MQLVKGRKQMFPTFTGDTVTRFIRHMEMVCQQSLSVATRFPAFAPGQAEDRCALSALLVTETGSGYLIAVHDDETTPSDIRAKAAELHALIQDEHTPVDG